MSRSRKNSPPPMVWAEIDLGNLRHNLKAIRRKLERRLPAGRQAGVLAIVKADAYGHGMKEVAKALAKEGVSFFGVANIHEASELRRTLPAAKILVLGSFHEEQVPSYARLKTRPTVSSEEDLKSLEKNLKARAHFPVHVKIDTGMGRLGVWHDDALALLKKISRSDKVAIEGVYTHFASADEASGKTTRKQAALFTKLQKEIEALGIRPRYWHAANSLGLVRFRPAHLDLVRPGILLYGLDPWSGGKLGLGLKPVLSLKARISFIKSVPAGRRLSYGGTHKTSRPTRIATLPVGYSHGYRVGFSNKSFVLVNGRRCPVVGRVTMDQTLVDVGGVPARRWDEVTLIGAQGGQRVSAEELARIADTIPYEIVCGVHSRIPRICKGLRK